MQPRFTFKLAGRQRMAGVDAWKVTYDERTTPTVIQGDGIDRRSRGAVWIADRDGAVVRTLLDLVISSQESLSTASVMVEYQREPRLDLWVPVRMHETYLETRAGTVMERIGGEATYSNFRPFGAPVRAFEPR